MYNEPSQAHCIKPDGRIYLIIFTLTKQSFNESLDFRNHSECHELQKFD